MFEGSVHVLRTGTEVTVQGRDDSIGGARICASPTLPQGYIAEAAQSHANGLDTKSARRIRVFVCEPVVIVAVGIEATCASEAPREIVGGNSIYTIVPGIPHLMTCPSDLLPWQGSATQLAAVNDPFTHVTI